jgi:hypothetical protein
MVPNGYTSSGRQAGGQETNMLSAEEYRTHSRDCIKWGKEPNVSKQRATILFAMSRSWAGLAGQMDRYEVVLKSEGEKTASVRGRR